MRRRFPRYNQVVGDAGGPAVDLDVLGTHLHLEAEDPPMPGKVAALDQAWEEAMSAFRQQVGIADWTSVQVFRPSDLSDTTYVIQRLEVRPPR